MYFYSNRTYSLFFLMCNKISTLCELLWTKVANVTVLFNAFLIASAKKIPSHNNYTSTNALLSEFIQWITYDRNCIHYIGCKCPDYKGYNRCTSPNYKGCMSPDHTGRVCPDYKCYMSGSQRMHFLVTRSACLQIILLTCLNEDKIISSSRCVHDHCFFFIKAQAIYKWLFIAQAIWHSITLYFHNVCLWMYDAYSIDGHRWRPHLLYR